MGDFDTLRSQLDPDDPRRRGTQFEHLCKWFLENDPVYRTELKQVWLWNEWPGRWAADAGIDLVAEDHNGELWAIQAKAYDPKYRVSKRDIDKFLSEAGRKVFTYRLLIATTDLIDRTGERTIQQQEKRTSFFRLSDLRAASVDWPASPNRLKPVAPRKPARPRPHQRQAIRNVVTGFETSDRGQMIMACGTGKTLTALFITEKLQAQRTLVLVPSLSLLKQTLNAWTANCSEEFASLPVCSDESVSAADDVALAHTTDVGVPVTTDPEVIASFLRRRGRRVVFATYQSSPQIETAFALGRVPGFDLVVADEAHRIAGPESSDFGTVLDPAAIKGSRRLFMTATPRYFTSRILKAAEEAKFEIASMDDEEKFGPVFHRLSFGEAIERDLLTDYQVVVVGVDDATYQQWAQKGTLVTRDGKTIENAARLAGQIGLAKAMRKYDLRRVISFHSRVAGARHFAASMPEVLAWMPARQRPQGKLWSRYASGEMPAGDRYVLLQHLGRLDDGDRGLLSNARCLAEGVDVPALDGVAFIDPRRSEVDIVQAVGRAIRKSEDKVVGTIVIPVFVDTESDPESALTDSVFRPVWDVLNALRAHDDNLGEEIDALRRAMGGGGGTPGLPTILQLDLPKNVGQDFISAFSARLVERTSPLWEFWFGLLLRYVDEYGTAAVVQGEEYGGRRLGLWVSTQRTLCSKGVLNSDRKERLEALPGWSWTPHADQWEEGFQHLRDYVDANGGAGIRDDYVSADGYRLGKWAGKQRTKWETLPPERKRRLEELPGWTLDARSALWERSLTALIRYVEENGQATPPRGLIIDGIDLDTWVRRQRRKWDELTEDRQRRLQALPGWTLNMLDDRWIEGYQHLLEYVEANGHSRVPQPYLSDDGYRLGKWLSVQRRIWDQLSDDRRVRLEKLPGWTLIARDQRWDEVFRHLEEYVAEYGDSRVPQPYVCPDGTRLGAWVAAQRAKWQSMSADRRQRLEQLPGWTLDRRTAFWEQGFRHLERYAEQYGSARPPSAYKIDGFKLGIWLQTQRRNWSNLDEERRKRLEQLPGWIINTQEDLWEEGFGHLLAYVGENGTALVPSDCMINGFKLGQWVTVQRAGWKKLRQDRKERLESLPGWAVSARDAWWEEGYAQLQHYTKETGHARPPQSTVTESGFKLGAWVAKQRARYAQDQMSKQRQRRLAALPGWEWSTR